MPDVLDIFVIVEHLEHLGHVLDIPLVGEGDVVLRDHFDLCGEQVVLGGKRFGHSSDIVRLRIDCEDVFFRFEIVRTGFQRRLKNGFLVRSSSSLSITMTPFLSNDHETQPAAPMFPPYLSK